MNASIIYFMCSAVGNKSATPYILKRDKRRRRKSVRTLYIHGRKKVVVDMPLTFMHQALLVAVTQTPITVFINYAMMTKRCRLLSHARKPAVRWKTLWDSSISDVACSSCSHFAFSLLKKQIAPFYKKIIHREIWFTDCYVFTLLYPLKNTPTPIVELFNFLIHGHILI